MLYAHQTSCYAKEKNELKQIRKYKKKAFSM